ncbi:hypothetical protein B9Z19DRAFT_962341 [Tuber borchii]|uniref:Uncharacterized protein n=1 Tax=Tuber borchii TaxID=42251 RepID=A0A2T7A7V2_TUBBO|nr:hypothetical protein B9Z19DRAFT_962341 [Tuber borchii]
MSYRQTRSKPSDALQTSLDSGTYSTRESLVEGSNERQLKPFSSSDQSRRDLIALARGFLQTLFAFVLLVICLWQFSKLQFLNKWEQRAFNMLSILLSGIASLGLGSLLGYLGSMLRWPLLARTKYQMQDVDSILGMARLIGSLRLIKRHVRERRISPTTFIVTAYLITNVLGRLSVAIFGLAYNMMDNTGIRHPILATNWASASWTNHADTATKEVYGPDPFDSEAAEGKAATLLNLSGDDNPYLVSDFRVSNSTLKEPVGPNDVEYSYQLKDFKEGYAILSNRIVHSTANCSLIEIGEGQYWRWNNWERTGPFGWGKDTHNVVSSVLQGSNESNTEFPQWISIENDYENDIFSQIYIACGYYAWECWPTLTETTANESHQIQPHERFFPSTSLYSLSALGKDQYGNSTQNYTLYTNDFSSSSFGPAALDGACYDYFFSMPLNETYWNDSRLWVSSLVARLPIVAITYANTVLPQYTRDTHSNQTAGTAYLRTSLEVNWHRVTLITVGIVVGQILAILVVLCYCNGVYTRDDSHLATAELLKTVINRFDGGKLMTGEELAVSLDGVLGAPVSYGTRGGQDGSPPEVDLASGLDANFPPLPPGQRFWRNSC